MQRASHFHTAATVGAGLDHTGDFRLRAHERAVESEIVRQCAEVHLEGGFVYLEQEFVGELLKGKRSCPFEENHVVRQGIEQSAFEQRIGSVEEMRFRFHESVQLPYVAAHADEHVHLARCEQGGHTMIEHIGGYARLLEIAQHQNRTMVGLFAARQEVEGDVERSKVRIIGIVDERQAAHALLHLEAHRHGVEMRHALADLCRGELELQPHDGGVDGIFDRGLVVEGDFKGHNALSVAVVQSDFRLAAVGYCRLADGFGLSCGRHHLGIEGGLRRTARPADALTGITECIETTVDEQIVHTVDQCRCMFEEFEFLQAFLVRGGEVRFVRRADVGQHAEGGTNDVAQGAHFARATDARFEERHTAVLVEQPHRKGDADLRVVGARAARHGFRRRKELIDPLLDDRFTVRTGDAHHGDVKLQPMLLGECLQGLQRRSHEQKVGGGVVRLCVVGEGAHHKVVDAAAIEVVNVAMAVARAGAEGKKQSGFGEDQRTTVGEQAFDVCVGVADASCGDQIADVRDAIRHVQIVFAATRRADPLEASARRVNRRRRVPRKYN